jgi:hypothetical protein
MRTRGDFRAPSPPYGKYSTEIQKSYPAGGTGTGSGNTYRMEVGDFFRQLRLRAFCTARRYELQSFHR